MRAGKIEAMCTCCMKGFCLIQGHFICLCVFICFRSSKCASLCDTKKVDLFTFVLPLFLRAQNMPHIACASNCDERLIHLPLYFTCEPNSCNILNIIALLSVLWAQIVHHIVPEIVSLIVIHTVKSLNRDLQSE